MSAQRSGQFGRIARARLLAVAAVLALALVSSVRAADTSLAPHADRPIAPASSAAIAPADAERPIAAPTGTLAGDAIRTIVALGGVLALAFVLKHILKRLGDPLAARRPSGVVQVLARFPFGKGQQVVLISIGTRIICVHQGGSHVRTLCEIQDPDEIASLRTRIEAGGSARAIFENELTRSLERDPAVAQSTPRTTGRRTVVTTPRPAVTETIDLTRGARRPALGMLGFGARS